MSAASKEITYDDYYMEGDIIRDKMSYEEYKKMRQKEKK